MSVSEQVPAGNFIERLPKAPKDGLVAALLLSFLSTAGLFYVNLGGAFLSAFVDGLGLTREMAGYVTSANKYGAAFGALLATVGARYVNWRKAAFTVLIALICVDLISCQISDGQALIAIRFLHGTIGGFLVGIGFSVIARTRSPDKVFGMLLIVQYSFGSLGIKFVPVLVGSLGHGVVFMALIIFSSLTLCMVAFIPNYPPRQGRVLSEEGLLSRSPRVPVVPLLAALMAVFAFQAANMGIADYAIELGKDRGLGIGAISWILSTANWLAIAGAVLVYVAETRFGRALPLMGGLLITVFATAAFHWSEFPTVYFLANAVTGIAWAFLIPYLLGLCAAFDGHGQTAALAGFVSKMGLASGPMIAAMLIDESNFGLIINVAVAGLVLCAATAIAPARLLDRGLRAAPLDETN